MILYLFGADTYRRQRFLTSKIVTPFVKKHKNGVMSSFDLGLEGEVDRLEEFLKANSLFSKVKLGLVYGVDQGDKKQSKKLLIRAEGLKDITLAVVADKKLPKAFDFLLKSKKWEFSSLSEVQFLSFIKAEASVKGLELSVEEIKNLGLLYGGDSWGVASEIEKLSLGGTSESGVKSTPFIDLIKVFSYSVDVGDKMRALYYLMRDSEGPAIFNMAAAFSAGRRKVLFADYDIAIKSGKLEYEEALLDVALD